MIKWAVHMMIEGPLRNNHYISIYFFTAPYAVHEL
jgi:hypothetical protein